MIVRVLRTAVIAALATGLVAFAAPAVSAAPSAPQVAVRSAVPSAIPLVYGERNIHVKRVQRILGVQQTGYFGPLTRKAVKRFQYVSKLRVTGVVNVATWSALLRREARQRAARAALTSTTSVDPTMTTAARGSRSARVLVSFAAWQASPHGKMIVKRESGGSCTITSPSGAYRGKWQMSSAFWKAYGGLNYASSADRATCLQQDKIAYKGWIASWWHPWGG